MKQITSIVLVLVLLALTGMTAVAKDTGSDKELKPGDTAVCPVTGDQLIITANTQFSKYNDKYYYFCCPACKPLFDADPQKYLAP